MFPTACFSSFSYYVSGHCPTHATYTNRRALTHLTQFAVTRRWLYEKQNLESDAPNSLWAFQLDTAKTIMNIFPLTYAIKSPAGYYDVATHLFNIKSPCCVFASHTTMTSSWRILAEKYTWRSIGKNWNCTDLPALRAINHLRPTPGPHSLRICNSTLFISHLSLNWIPLSLIQLFTVVQCITHQILSASILLKFLSHLTDRQVCLSHDRLQNVQDWKQPIKRN